MQKNRIWFILFIILLIINIIGTYIYLSINSTSQINEKDILIKQLKEELISIKSDYISNAKELKYLLEALLENSDELQAYLPEYKEINKDIFEEKLRQKIVKLDILISSMEEN